MTNLFAPRDTLIRHLRLLIDSNTLRSVESANEFADLLDGKLPLSTAPPMWSMTNTATSRCRAVRRR